MEQNHGRYKYVYTIYCPTLSAIRIMSASDILPAVYSRMQLYVGEIVQHR